jgi:hypothetical protein
VIAGANTTANHIPKPSGLDFTNQGNKRNRRGLQDSNDPRAFVKLDGPGHAL